MGECIWARRNCSLDKDYAQECDIVSGRLEEQNYSKELTERGKQLANERDQDFLINSDHGPLARMGKAYIL